MRSCGLSYVDVRQYLATIISCTDNIAERKIRYIRIARYQFRKIMQNRRSSTLFVATFIVLLGLPLVLSHSIVPSAGGTTTTTEQLVTDSTAQYIGKVTVAALPTPTEGTVTPLSLPDLSLPTQQQVGTDPPAPIVTPGS